MLGLFGRVGGRLIIGVIIAVALGVGGFFFRDSISGSVVDLRVGDCFDLATGSETVKEVQHHPCTESHGAEVVALFEYPAGSSDPYPSRDVLRNFAANQCLTAFRTYTGRDPVTDPVLTLGWMYPVTDGWAQGDRGVTCYLVAVDDSQMRQSYRRATS